MTRVLSAAALLLTPVTGGVALAQEATGATTERVDTTDQLKQLGGQLLMSVFDRLTKRKATPAPAAAAEPASATDMKASDATTEPPSDTTGEPTDAPVEDAPVAEPASAKSAKAAPAPAFLRQRKMTTPQRRSSK